MRKNDISYKKISFSHFNYFGHMSPKIGKEILVAQMNKNATIG